MLSLDIFAKIHNDMYQYLFLRVLVYIFDSSQLLLQYFALSERRLRINNYAETASCLPTNLPPLQ